MRRRRRAAGQGRCCWASSLPLAMVREGLLYRNFGISARMRVCRHWRRGEARESGECGFDPRPVVDGRFLAGDDGDYDLVPAGAAQCLDALRQLLLGRGKGGTADQFGADKFFFFRLYKREVAAMVEQVTRIG